MDKKSKTLTIIALILLTLSTALWIYKPNKYTEVELSKLTYQLEKGNVTEITVDENKSVIKATLKNGDLLQAKYSEQDYSSLSQQYFTPLSAAGKLKVEIKNSFEYGTAAGFLVQIIFYSLFGYLIYTMYGKNKYSSVPIKGENTAVRFSDIAGMIEEKQELAEVVDFLRNPDKYRKIGARIPKGVLMAGKPGCGKTYLSKAVAGEAGVPFFSVSGSEFVELFVGMGASRVRTLFKEARKSSPCIIFIDEIDAIGRKRGVAENGANDERESTLNQILVEMDGFSTTENIIVLAATNRPDILDPALLRAGRFDRQVNIGLPDINGRKDIFELYCRNKNLSDDINTEILAKRTPGFTPADIENLMNEAAILSVRYNKDAIDMDTIEKAITKILAGPEKSSKVISEKEKYLTAVHEAGHAICSYYLETTDPVHQISIIPHGYGAGGFTLSLPTEDRLYDTKRSMTEELVMLLGGRAAESIKLGDVSTGASNDIERATQTARDMISRYGFSEILGTVTYGEDNSEKTQNAIDEEIRSLVDDCLEKAEDIIRLHVSELDRVTELLLEKETLTGDEFIDAISA